jgi:hypothetical protein
MKKLLNVLGVILACLVLLLVVARITGFEPNGPRPGSALPSLLLSRGTRVPSRQELERERSPRSKKYPELKLPPGGTIVLFHVLDN